MILVEINSGREASKTGVFPEDLGELIQRLAGLEHVQVHGLMTMGPASGDPEDARPFFRETKEAFERMATAKIPPRSTGPCRF